MACPPSLARFVWLVGALLVGTSLAFGQAAGEITGKIADASGAVLRGVEVTATHTPTGMTRTVVSSQSGNYRFVLLSPGSYAIKATLSGFKTAVRDGIRVTVGEVVHIDMTLEVGPISQTVTVTSETPTVNTEQGRVSTLVEGSQIVDMPLNGRNVYQLIQLAPGTVNVENTILESGTGVGNGNTTSVNGGRVTANGFWLDGVSNKGVSGGTNLDPTVDSIQEFRMETLNFSAEFGNSSGSVVNVASKSGTNRFHGTAYEFLRNDNLDAREFFDDRKPEFKQNQFGFSLGGPIRKNSTFFFGSYEGLRIRTGQSKIQTFESSQWSSFVQSYGAPVARFLYKNYPGKAITTVTDTVGSYFAGQGLIPSATQANVDTFLRSEFNAPAGALKVGDPMAGETSYFTPDSYDQDQVSIKIDQELRGGKDKLMGRYTRNRSESPVVYSRAAFNSPSVLGGDHLVLSETHIAAPTVINELRAGLNRGLTTIKAGDPGVPQIIDGSNGVTTFGAYNGYPQVLHENGFNYSDVVSISRGRHSIKVGAEFRRNQENSDFDVGRPQYTFYGLVYLALDDPYYQVGGVDPHITDGTRKAELRSNARGWRNSEFGLFFNDDWKVRPNLTLNLGVRYDLYTRLNDVQGRTTKFDLSTGTNIFERLRKGDFALADALSSGDHNNIAPRVGFAWDPFSNGKMSLRGGFGVAYQSNVYNPLTNSRWNPPLYSFNLICDICGRPRQTVLYGPQKAGQAVTATGPNPNIGAGFYEGNIIAYDPTNTNSNFLTGIANPNMRDPYVMSWFVGLQRELMRNTMLEVNYVGTGGRKIIRAENFNRFAGDRIGKASPNGEFAGSTALDRVNPNYGILRFVENSTNSSYNALQTQVSRRFTRGWALNANYTWSHSLDTRSTWHSGSTTTNLAQEGYSTDVSNQHLDYGRSIFDARHRFIFSYLWEVPFFRHTAGPARWLLGDWQVNGGLSLQSGLPFTPYDSRSFTGGGDYNADGTANDRPNTPSIGNAFSGPDRSTWRNPGAGPFKIPTANPLGIPTTDEKIAFFGKPANGTVGTLGRNTYEGPGYANQDFAVFKNFRLPVNGEAKLQFRFEFFNVFNRVNFQQPEPRLNNSLFGRPFGAFDARQIQIGMKVIF